jgi:hypothetical protein
VREKFAHKEKKMAKKTWLRGAALALIAALALAGCSKKAGAQTSGGKESPTSDFKYDLTADKQGILIKGYTGDGGKVVVPAKIEDMPVLEIGDSAFYQKKSIISITIPNTVRKLGTRAFASTGITSFTMPDSVTELVISATNNDNSKPKAGDSDLFRGCSSLTEIKFSDNLEILPGGVCSNNMALKKINLPKSLKMIARNAFTGCSELTDLVIPDTLSQIEFVAYQSWRDTKVKYQFPKEWSPNHAYEDFGYNLASEKGSGNGTVSGNQFNMFSGCSKLPLATRSKLEAWGYKGSF